MFDKIINVSGVDVVLRPYTEKRRKQLEGINADIQKWIEEHPTATYSDLPIKQRAKWYKAKAEILWLTEKPLSIDFFESEDFELTLLKDSEEFFFQTQRYL